MQAKGSEYLRSCFIPENMKKPPSKVAHNQPQFFFSLLPTGPKPAQISISVQLLTARLIYNDFAWNIVCEYIQYDLKENFFGY